MPNRHTLHHIRREYQGAPLQTDTMHPDPITQLSHWLEDAQYSSVLDPTAMTLATVTAQCRPQARIVLLKGLSTQGLVFYTHSLSDKGRALALNPWASALFYWDQLDRQVRIEGKVSKLPKTETCQYFASRPRDSQLAALISEQSHPAHSRKTLEARFEAAQNTYAQQPIPCPKHWHGYRLTPELFEFWQGQPSRLHDRIRYKKQQNCWIRERLAP